MMSTTTAKVETEPITIESLWKIYTEEKFIPMIFKPTGETVYVTSQFLDWIERYSQRQAQPTDGGQK